MINISTIAIITKFYNCKFGYWNILEAVLDRHKSNFRCDRFTSINYYYYYYYFGLVLGNLKLSYIYLSALARLFACEENVGK